MMKKNCLPIVAALSICALFIYDKSVAQGMHFSQYYNAPLLLNPANAGLMSENDFRLGVNYRNQWSRIPAPYKTISAYGDCQLLRNMNSTNWMGIGGAVFNDVAGDGELSLTRFDGAIAYHIMAGETSMISVGLSAGYAQRSVNYNKLTFNKQWDGFEFKYDWDNGEQLGTIKTKYWDVGAGINYAYFPNEFTYIKVGAGLAHVNQPYESFYGAKVNQVGIRPTGNIDVLVRTNETLIINPSIYYTTQKGASEFVFGSLGMIYVSGEEEAPTQLVLGAFYRWNEAAIAAVGMQWSGFRVMASYDYTVSSLSVENKGHGAMEFGISYQGVYGDMSRGRRTINCPRF